MQRHWEIVWICARDFFQLCFEAGELIRQHSLKQRDLAGKMRIERFLADAQLRRQIVHGHAAESVAEKCARAASTMRCRLASAVRFRGTDFLVSFMSWMISNSSC